MKKLLATLLVLCMCLSLCACGEYKKVDEAILAIGEVTLGSETAIADASALYDGLSDEDKSKVENYTILQDAQEKLESLKRIASVEEYIDAIGVVTVDSGDAIELAFQEYDKLNAEEQEKVSNLESLVEAEWRFLELTQHWFIQNYVDDFGDPTDEGYVYGTFTGTFSNTATMGSDLKVMVAMLPESTGDGYMISFRLLEYENHLATYYKNDLINLDFKINGETYSVELMGFAPNGDLYLTDHWSYQNKNLAKKNTDRKTAYDTFFKALEENTGEISCLITIGDENDIVWYSSGDSTYKFKIDGYGFADKLAELNSKE